MRRLTATVACAVTAIAAVATQTTPAPAATAQSSGTITTRLHAAIDRLPVSPETRAGYDRAKFRHWVDADGDCRDSRDEVLAQESQVPVRGCDIQQGLWVSYYDGATTRASTGFDIDHLVPLAEAWDSGARRWGSATRERFANDLRDPRSLVAVTASSNRSKSDRDPAEWMPPLGRCRYIRQWVAVKIRWSLQVDRAEKRALRRQASGCKDSTIRVRRAVIATGGGGTAPDAGTPVSDDGGQADPRFSTCTEAKAHGYGPYYQGRDVEYGWYTDADSDGIVCE